MAPYPLLLNTIVCLKVRFEKDILSYLTLIEKYLEIKKVVKNWLIFANERDILHDEAEMLTTRLKSLGRKFSQDKLNIRK